METKVRDFMRPGVLTCRKETRIGQVAVMLDQHKVHSLMVTDRDGRIIGVITDFDLLAGEWLSQDAESLNVMKSLTAGDLMSSPVASIEADAPIKEAADRMIKEVIRRLLVTDKGKPVGVISVSDIVAHIAMSAPIGRGQVGDVMSDAYLVCRDKTPIAAAARAMTSTGWRSVLVVDSKGSPLGVVSGLDLLPYCLDDECGTKLVTEVMHPPLTVSIDATLQEAANKMIESHYHRLIVVDPDDPDSMPLGVVSSFDIVGLMAHPDSVWQK
jgi:CBS domain-containing protein